MTERSEEDLAAELLDSAGLGANDFAIEPIDSVGLLNTHWLVRTAGGERYVMRRYGWPWPVPERFDRMAKEAWLLPRLSEAGVPAPLVLAAQRDDHVSAMLLSYVDGEPLGVFDERTDAMWGVTGAALRTVHECDIGLLGAPPGLLVAGGVDAFEGGWCGWHVHNTYDHAIRLSRDRPDLRVDADRCAAVVASAADRLDDRPVRLIHTDANPWNVLVTADGGQATWVDWEFAWLGDPVYDFVRLTLARKRDLGPLPPAVFDGYGADPTEDPVFAVYELGFHLWMGNEALDPLLPLQATYDNSESYLREVDSHLSRLESLFS